jgi:predicted nucleic acid-binding protein
MKRYALDTNIVSYILRGDEPVGECVRRAISEGAEILIPPIVYYEVARGFLLRSAPVKEFQWKRLCGVFQVGTDTREVFDCAAGLYADTRLRGYAVEDADLLIAAFCLVSGCVLVTNNIRHFSVISGLRVENWTEQ